MDWYCRSRPEERAEENDMGKKSLANNEIMFIITFLFLPYVDYPITPTGFFYAVDYVAYKSD